MWRRLSLAILMASVLACAQTVPTPTPTPTPTPFPTPTPEPPPSSYTLAIVEFEDDFDPAPDPAKLAQLRRFLSHVPDQYPRAVLVDIEGLSETRELRAALELEDLGLSGALLPLLSSLVRSVTITTPNSEASGIALLEGDLSIDGLLRLARGVGISFAPEPESYRGHQIWSGDAFGLSSLSVAASGDDIIVISQDAPSASPGPTQLVKSVLDASDGTVASLLDSAPLTNLLSQLPSGLVTVILSGCRQLENIQGIPALAGCTGVALSVDLAPEDKLVAHLLVGFTGTAEAEAALPVLREAVISGELRLREVAFRREGALVRVRAIGETSEILAIIEDVVSQ